MHSQIETNRLKNLAGSKLKKFLNTQFKELVYQNIILDYQAEKNFQHKDYAYNRQYLVNFIIETLDNKFILINSSTSFRNDRFKQQAYDMNGILNNSEISSDIIASVLLYPDSEINNTTFLSFRKKVREGNAFSPASHMLILSEFYEFLENHKASVESKLEDIDISEETNAQQKDGSYYGKAGNALEKEVVNILNNNDFLVQYKTDQCQNIIFKSILDQLCDHRLKKEQITSISSTNTVQKLVSGGNAKTDVIINISTINEEVIKTLSIKKSSKRVVSCHDYKYNDFVRVLNISNIKLKEYFKLFQRYPSYSDFKQNLPQNYSVNEFEQMLEPYTQILTEWALTGKHDDENIKAPLKQISNYLLIVKEDQVFCSDFKSYIKKLYAKGNLKYGVPFSWTYPSKRRGMRIQLKMPIIIDRD